MLSDMNFSDSILSNDLRSIWNLWSKSGPCMDEFGVVVSLPNGRLALVPISENGFEVGASTYLRDDYPVFSSRPPAEPVLIPYSALDDTGEFIEPEFWEYLQAAIDKKKNAVR